MRRMVVLDGYTLNPGDLTWEGLQEFGECIVHERTSPEQVMARAKGAAVLFTNKVVLTRDAIGALPDLEYVGVLATGYDVVDIDAARQCGVTVTNVPEYGTDSVAQMTFAHLLNLTQHVAHHARTVREGMWAACPDFCYWQHPLIELAGKNLGLVGCGRIGRRLARIADAFGMHVLCYDPGAPRVLAGIERVADLHDLLRRADVVSIHCPLTAETSGMFNADRLACMKSTAFLINTSRGAVVEEQALADALNAGKIAGAGLDVVASEPMASDNPLRNARNCFVSPHIAWATRAARQRLMRTAVENLQAFLDGTPVNVVS